MMSLANYLAPSIFLSDSTTPEERLWYAVVSQVIADCDAPIKQSKKMAKILGIAPLTMKGDFDSILSQISHPWFSVCCGFIDFHPRHVLKAVLKIADESGFNELSFVTDEVYTRRAMEMIKERPELAIALLGPLNKYGGYCKREKIKRKNRGDGTGPVPSGRGRGRPKKVFRKVA